VKCFYCDGGLRNWVPEDVPWVEHARWFGQCGFVKLVKGDDFIRECAPDQQRAGMDVDERNEANIEVSQTTVDRLMASATAQEVLSMGVDAERVKAALVERAKRTEIPFDTANQLLEAIFRGRRYVHPHQGHYDSLWDIYRDQGTTAAATEAVSDQRQEPEPEPAEMDEEPSSASEPLQSMVRLFSP